MQQTTWIPHDTLKENMCKQTKDKDMFTTRKSWAGGTVCWWDSRLDE